MSEDQTFRAKTFLNVSKLMNNIDVPEEATHIRVTFDNVLSGGGNYKSSKSIRVLSVKAIKDSTVLKEYDMMDIFKIAEGINVWLNVGRQMKEYKHALTKILHCLDIDLQQKTFINQKGETISYYPIQYVSVKEGDESNRVMNRLEKELREKELEYVNNETSKKEKTEAHDNETEIDPEMF